MPSGDGFPIGYVSLQTGLSVHVLRAWEKRYRAVLPDRSVSNRRVYSPDDVTRLRLLKAAVDSGHHISLVADLDQGKLVALTDLDNQSSTSSGVPVHDPSASPVSVQNVVDRCLKAVATFDGDGLRRVLRRAELSLNRQDLIRTVIAPLMQTIGHRWSVGQMRIAHEHLASAVIRDQLGSLLNRGLDKLSIQSRMLIAAPSGQWCHLGALAVALTVRDQGWEPVFLGPNLPSEEIAAAASIVRPQMIALSITCRVDDAFMHSELTKLTDWIDGRCPLIVGGQASKRYRKSIEAVGAIFCPTTTDLVGQLH
ncbi:MAG: cobalamin B12-binding domain-containing protein [Desulfobacterales bacterium]|jgi:DNA-binding transcriptional MerR regulator/methylmalonyl-CoA mutase cobalamin-binding subunit